jgi:hypothetical protein
MNPNPTHGVLFLPPLPDRDDLKIGDQGLEYPFYNAITLQDYARAAVLADRARRPAGVGARPLFCNYCGQEGHTEESCDRAPGVTETGVGTLGGKTLPQSRETPPPGGEG